MPDLSPDQAIQALRGLPEDRQRAILAKLSPEVKQGIMGKLTAGASSAPAAPSAPQPKERTFGNYLDEGVSGIGRGIMNDVTGVAQTVMHPIDTLVSLRNQAQQSVTAAQKEYAGTDGTQGQKLAAGALGLLENAPMIGGMVQHAEQGGAEMGSPEGVGAAAEGITTFAAPEVMAKGVGAVAKALPDIPGKVVRGATGTGPKTVRDLVKETKAANDLGEATAGAANVVEGRRADLKKQVYDKSEELRARIETARNNALKVGNSKYSTVNEALSGFPADMEKIHGLYGAASDAIGETQAVPTVLSRVGKALEHGEQLSYADEQALYSDLGKELSKGTLPGNVFHAYDALHEGVGEDMQRIADSQGMGEQLTDARNYWRRMKQTFGRPSSVRDVANKTLGTVSPEFVKQDALNNRVRLLSDFDPAIGQVAGDVTGARRSLKDLPKAKTTEFTPQKIGPAELKAAKEKGLERAANTVSHRGMWAAAYPVFSALRSIWSGGVPNPLAVGVESAGIAATVATVSRMMRSPKVVEFLTKATPEDVAQIPPEMRGDFPKILTQAQKRGINVSPALIRAFTGTAAAGTRKYDVETGTDAAAPSP